MIEGQCACGALAWRAPEPAWLHTCNCSYCHRSGALWGEVPPEHTELFITTPPLRYIRGDACLAFNFCRTCGNLAWWRSLEPNPDRMKLNFRLADPALIANLRVRIFDGADTWRYLDPDP